MWIYPVIVSVMVGIGFSVLQSIKNKRNEKKQIKNLRDSVSKLEREIHSIQDIPLNGKVIPKENSQFACYSGLLNALTFTIEFKCKNIDSDKLFEFAKILGECKSLYEQILRENNMGFFKLIMEIFDRFEKLEWLKFKSSNNEL